jgi:hypothetical protein
MQATQTTDGEKDSPEACPKLGFWDNAASHYSRPTNLHRCYAAGTPATVTPDQQTHLCLSQEFGRCPRLADLSGSATTTATATPALELPRFRATRRVARAKEPDICFHHFCPLRSSFDS